jgi:hypothetical protein
MLISSLAQVSKPVKKESIYEPKLLYSQIVSSSLLLKPPATNVPRQQRDLIRPECVPFSNKPREKTEKQKEKSRRFQQIKRQKKRAQRRLSKSASDSSQVQPSVDADSFSSYQLSLWQAPSFEEDDFFVPDTWYYSYAGGWRRRLVLLDDGTSAKAFYWAPEGGYLNRQLQAPGFSLSPYDSEDSFGLFGSPIRTGNPYLQQREAHSFYPTSSRMGSGTPVIGLVSTRAELTMLL